MKLKIYSQSGTLKLAASTSSSSTWSEELMVENALSVSFTHFAYVPLDVNDYVLLSGIRFSVKKEYKPKQKDRQTYSYSVKFYAPVHDAEQVIYLNLTDGQYEPHFSLDGSPREHLQKWVDNMNRIYGEERWRIGDVVDAPNKTIEYSGTSCWDSLGTIAETFGTEWWADGFHINLCRCERGERVELGYMRGLTSLVQSENSDDVKFFTRLIPLGSTRNIDRSRYGFSRLQLPGREKYIDRNTQYGLYEHVESDAFAGIYPHYTGTVSSVRSEEKTGEDKKPFTVYYFKDDGMEFNPCDNEIAGLVKHVSFHMGELAGRDFEANYYPAAKEWEIINTYPDEDTQIPGGNLVPAVGDRYIPWNFRMPEAYEVQAEKDYAAAVDDFLSSYSEDIAKYGGDTDYTYVDRNSVPLQLGQSVRLLSEEYFPGTGYRDSRMTKVVRKLDNLSMATIECTNRVGKGWKRNVDDAVANLQYIVGEKMDRAVIDVLKTWDSRDPSNYNVFSALRAIKEITSRAISKTGPDETEFPVKFLGGLISDNIESQDFSSGPLGSGMMLRTNPETGDSYLEVDRMFVRKSAEFTQLLIQELKHAGGQIVLTPASMKCSKVTEYSTFYRCYFETTEGNHTIVNQFVTGDQARRQTFNVKSGLNNNVSNTYYWRLVTGTGDDYIDLSKDDCDANSTVPMAGDEIVQLGNRNDVSRQKAIILSSFGDDAPCLQHFKGINSFSLAGKKITEIGEDSMFTGKVTIGKGSTGFKNMDDAPDMDAIENDISGIKTKIDNIPSEVKDAVARNLGYTDYPALEATAAKGRTIIKDGKINTVLIEATAIITAQLISDAISANSLNVGDRFKVAKNGTVELVDAVVSGTVRSSNDGRRVEFNPSNGSLDLYSNNVLWGTVGWSGNYPKVLLYGKSTGVYTEIMANRILFNNLGKSGDTELASLTIDLANFQKTSSISNGVLYSGDDGIVRIKDGDFVEPAKNYEVTLSASPVEGGTVTGGGVKEENSRGTISAMPNSGYAFEKWSDGDTNASRTIIWDRNKELTAYFVTLTIYYTITLDVSPDNSGRVSGGGTKEAGQVGIISAVAEAGYTFSRWSDGNTEASRNITWDGNKTLTAYFDEIATEKETVWGADFYNNSAAVLAAPLNTMTGLALGPTAEYTFDYAYDGEGALMFIFDRNNVSYCYIFDNRQVYFLKKGSNGNYNVWHALFPVSISGKRRFELVVKTSYSTLDSSGITASINGIVLTEKEYATSFYDVLTVGTTLKQTIKAYNDSTGVKLISIAVNSNKLSFENKNLTWNNIGTTFAVEGVPAGSLIKEITVDALT